MGMTDNLRDIIGRQKEVLSDLEAEYKAIESSDLVKENAELKASLEGLRAALDRAKENETSLSEENKGLKDALFEHIYNEKVNFANLSAEKLDIYFHSNIDKEVNRLKELEDSVRARIDYIRQTLVLIRADARDDLSGRLDELSALLDKKVTEARVNAEATPGAFTQKERDALEALKDEQITDEQISAVLKKNNLERFVGLNVLNAIGVFLLIAGAITLARFTYAFLSDFLKGIMLFALGAVMLAAGEALNKKIPNAFSLGISAGGVGILYTALAMSYFALKILDMYPALLICALITAAAFILSNRYDAQIIAAFALLGGYLPMFSIGEDITIRYGAMAYFVILNLLALLISFSKKWRVTSFIGLFLNIAGTYYICFGFGFRFFAYYSGEKSATEKIITILYALFAFMIYTLIPIVGAYRAGARFKNSDVVSLAINTFFSSLIIYGVFYDYGLEDYNGLLAVVFAVIYLLVGRFIEAKFSDEERHTRALFYLTGLAFVVLVIPLQFGRAWLSLGWLAEGVLLAGYGILAEEKKFRQIGYVICLLCLCAFFMFDCERIWHYMFAYKYFAITLGSLLILAAYMYKKLMSGLFVKIYKIIALANLWFFSMYMILDKLSSMLYKTYGVGSLFKVGYLTGGAAVTATFCLAYAYIRIKLLTDFSVKALSITLYAVGIVALGLINSATSPLPGAYFSVYTPAPGITIIGTSILLALGALSVFAMRDLIRIAVFERGLGVQWYPLIISAYFVAIFTQNLITHFGLLFSSAAISIIYVLTALGWTIYGFARRYSMIRKFGLGLAILSVMKLFIIDLSSLTRGYQIITYFSLGLTLIAISFVYQYFSKRLELKEGIFADAKKDI